MVSICKVAVNCPQFALLLDCSDKQIAKSSTKALETTKPSAKNTLIVESYPLLLYPKPSKTPLKRFSKAGVVFFKHHPTSSQNLRFPMLFFSPTVMEQPTIFPLKSKLPVRTSLSCDSHRIASITEIRERASLKSNNKQQVKKKKRNFSKNATSFPKQAQIRHTTDVSHEHPWWH